MLFKSKKTKAVTLTFATIMVCLLFAGYMYKRIKNQSDMSNVLAMAGISGAKVFTLEPTRTMLIDIELAKSNPKDVLEKLETALDGKTIEYGKIRAQYSDPNSAAAKSAFESSYAYAVRILLLKKWKPGMTKEMIVKNYLDMTKHLKTQYDFKDHADEFLGFN